SVVALEAKIHLEATVGEVHELRTDPGAAPLPVAARIDAGDEFGRLPDQSPPSVLAHLSHRQSAESEIVAQEERGLATKDLDQFVPCEAFPTPVLLTPEGGHRGRADLGTAVHRHCEMHAEERVVELRD